MLSSATIIPALTQHHERWKARAEAWRRIHRGLGAIGLHSMGLGSSGFGPAGPGLDPDFSHLAEVHDFGTNPGVLRMFTYLPAQMPQSPALVVVLHGCAQTAAGYDLGAGWSTLADRHGFALLLPQQQMTNHPNTCFNWFLPGDIERDRGEALSIRQMIDTMTAAYGIDRGRIFITGLSAGGAMTSVMLAAYPEVFAGGAIIAGLPYGTAANVNEALESMFHVRARPAHEWGDLVRGASRHEGPWPRVSVWHGSADAVVRPENAEEIVKQWVDVHRLDTAPSLTEAVDGYPRRVWRDRAGREVVESYTIAGMAHGAPLAAGPADMHCGIPGAFLHDVGISSSHHVTKFWGLTAPPRLEAESSSGTTAQPGRRWLPAWLTGRARE